MAPGMWFSIDMMQPYRLRQIILDTTKSGGDYPRGYSVSLSEDGETWSEPILQGQGRSAITEFVFPAGTTARKVRIEQTGSNGLFWSIHELMVYGEPAE